MNLYRVHQQLITNPLPNIRSAVFSALDAAALTVPTGEIAITAGSRGIDRIDEVILSVGEWLKQKGATSFIVPAMGSHNGATAEGQRSMIESFGITEKAMGMENSIQYGCRSSGVRRLRKCFYGSALRRCCWRAGHESN